MQIYMKSIDLTPVFEQYKGLWVAFTDSYKVISANKNARKVFDEAKQKGYKEPILFKVPEENVPFFGAI